MNRKTTEAFVMLLTGGVIYFYFEILVRGFSHISMFFLGGLCFYLVGRIGGFILRDNTLFIVKIFKIMIISAVIITTLEFLTGYIVNLYLDLHVWDYSNMPMNFRGQICVLYSVLWSLMGLPCVYFYGLINWFIFEDVGNKSLQESI